MHSSQDERVNAPLSESRLSEAGGLQGRVRSKANWRCIESRVQNATEGAFLFFTESSPMPVITLPALAVHITAAETAMAPLDEFAFSMVRISAYRGRSFQAIVDGVSEERGRHFRLIVDDVSA